MYKQILLTGATGALGPASAAELVRTGAAERIAILMRATSEKELGERFGKWLEVVESLLLPEERGKAERVLFPVSGDILQDGLGVERTIQAGTDVVIHAAADTNFAAPPARQTEVNVGGTRRTLEWAGGCRNLKRYVLVSSVFVSGSRTGRILETATETPPDFVTHYQRTKWESEHVALTSGLPVGIARISLILGSHATGSVQRTGAVHSLIKWFARGLVPMVPGHPEAKADVIATETATRCLARAVTGDWGGVPNGKPPIWHIAAGDHAPKMVELIDFVYQHFAHSAAWRRKQIQHPRMVEQQEFDRFVDSIEASRHPVLAQSLRSINRFLPDLGFPKIYDSTTSESLCGGPLPLYDWRETMDRIIRYCCPVPG
jgi:nucleoside-diphosphate-sugar epimerase